jgi:hypothetical protein
MTYDVQRSRVVLFGGRALSAAQPVDETWEYDGTRWLRNAAGAAMPARYGPALAHDVRRGRTVLFGGAESSFLDDTWEYDGADWSMIQVGQRPPGRMYHSLVHDAHRGRVVLFGGYLTSYAGRNDTWEYDGATWTRNVTATVPPGRYGHAAAYDPGRGRMVIFGGWNGGRLGDTWEYDGTNWAQIATASAPSPRDGAAMAHDSGRGCMVLFGGADLGDTWEYDGADWHLANPLTSPSPRAQHAMAYDTVRGRTVLFGGVHYVELDDCWEYDGGNWTQVATGSGPARRRTTAMVYDLVRQRTVLFGGQSVLNYYCDTWELQPAAVATWTRLGTGCSVNAGAPGLAPAANAVPIMGTAFTLQLAPLPPVPGVALLSFGFDLVQWNGASLPLSLDPVGLAGCKLWVAPFPGAHVLLGHGGSSTSFTFPIPRDPGLVGAVVGVQAAAFDPAVPAGIGAISNAGIMRLH